MTAIGKYLAESDFDIVLLEEVWTHEDFETLKRLCSSVYPFSHFFDHGIIGSGTCIFTKYRLKNANFHEFTMNGYPVKFWHDFTVFCQTSSLTCKISKKSKTHIFPGTLEESVFMEEYE